MSLHFPGLAIGRIVHFVNHRGEHEAAIVTSVREAVSEELQRQGNCDVSSIPTNWGFVVPHQGVVFDDSHKPGTVHWPEKE